MRIRKLNQRGFDHVMMAVAVVVLVGVIGTATLVYTHAATASYVVFKLNGNNACLEVTDLATCAANSREVDYLKPKAGSTNFLLKDLAGYCLEDASGNYQSVLASKGGHQIRPILTTKCDSNSKNQQWSWVGPGKHELANAATNNKGCLNAAGASSKLGTPVIMYICNGQWNENWYEASTTTK